MTILTIYNNPSDYPGKFVVRKWTVTGLKPVEMVAMIDPVAIVDSLEEARKFIPKGKFLMDREPHDDPTIIENWI